MNHEFLPKIDVSIDEQTGVIRAAYLRVRSGAVTETREVAEGRAFADYDADGWLLGIELLAACEVDLLDRLAARESEAVKRFVRGGPPRELVMV